MDSLLAARVIMGSSLAFHILFASAGMAMPFLMAMAHYRALRSGDGSDDALRRMWQKGVAILFATGAVSGTVLSFELGLLWPTFMARAGAVIGMPFSWEGTAFFLEAICIGLYLYGEGRMPRWLHFATGLLVGISGVASAIFVVSANAWMNAPQGFTSLSPATDIDPVRAMFNRAWLHESLHMVLAAFEAVGFAVAGIHAWLLLRDKNPELNRRALHIALTIGSIAAILQPLSGDFAAKRVASLQPEKLAAMEGLFVTQAYAPLAIFGLPDAQTETLRGAIELPGALSFLAFGRFDATVRGLRDFPRDTWPPLVPTHIAFQIMVGCGMLLAFVALLFSLYALRRRVLPRWLLWLIALCTPLGFVALEAGWVVTEVGRQPWIVYGLLRTKDAVTPVPGLTYHLILFLGLYALLSVLVIGLMLRQIRVANATPVSAPPSAH